MSERKVLNELALFAGAGGGILGGKLLGWHTVCAVEIEDYPRKVLLQRQKDGILDRFPIWDDISTFDGKPWRGAVDIITGGFPCQDISAAGKGAGIDGERSGLWKEMARVVCEVKPRFVYVENSPMLTLRGLGRVLGDLAALGYNARWCVLGADAAGAPHKRERIWILAYSKEIGVNRVDRNDNEKKRKNRVCTNEFDGSSKRQITWWENDPTEIPDTTKERLQNRSKIKVEQSKKIKKPERPSSDRNKWPAQSGLGRVAYGVAHRVDRLKTIGNGQVPSVAALAFIILSEGLI